MSIKKRMLLYDSLYFLYFVLFSGSIFTTWTSLFFFFVQPLILLPAIAIRPREYNIGKLRFMIICLLLTIMTIILIIAYPLGVDVKIGTLWPIWLKLIVGSCFASCAIIMISKLIEDMKFVERVGG